jgi:cell shape-determining protein MreD
MVGLSTIVAQTTILRLPFFRDVFYDLLIPLVVSLSLNFSNRKSLLIVVILGLIMDLLSGGIFGLYLCTYFWIFVSVRSLSRYFHVGDRMFQSVLIGVCVLGQHLLFCISVAPPWEGTQLLASQAAPVLVQTILAALTGPGILMLLRRLQARLQTLTSGARRQTGILQSGDG